MNILICIKQVPNTDKIKIDKEKHTLIRDGIDSIINPYDTFALEFALRIKDQYENTKISVISMGPKQAEKALRQALSLSADNAYLVTDKSFSGSDTLATSYILSKAINHIEKVEGQFDLILCGKQAIDGDTAQVGPELAEHLNRLQVTGVREINVADNSFIVKKETDEGFEILQVPNHCLLTITKPDFEIRFPSLKMKMKSKKIPIEILDLNNLIDIDKSKIGLKGSPTKVKKTYVNEINKECIEINGSIQEITDQLYNLIEK